MPPPTSTSALKTSRGSLSRRSVKAVPPSTPGSRVEPEPDICSREVIGVTCFIFSSCGYRAGLLICNYMLSVSEILIERSLHGRAGLGCVILYYTILYCAILCYAMLYCIILY